MENIDLKDKLTNWRITLLEPEPLHNNDDDDELGQYLEIALVERFRDNVRRVQDRRYESTKPSYRADIDG